MTPEAAGNIPQIEESIPFQRKAFLTSQESFPDFTRNDSFARNDNLTKRNDNLTKRNDKMRQRNHSFLTKESFL